MSVLTEKVANVRPPWPIDLDLYYLLPDGNDFYALFFPNGLSKMLTDRNCVVPGQRHAISAYSVRPNRLETTLKTMLVGFKRILQRNLGTGNAWLA